MLGQLGSFRRRCQRVTQSFALRGIATQKQGRRQQPAPPPPPDPPEKIEWWAVDGELFKVEKFDVKKVLSPLENEHISNRRRRRQLIKHISQTRLNFKLHNQDSYWAAYMRRFQIVRDEWEKRVWDPPPVLPPKRRHPTWLAEETQKYVWQDPRREAYQSGVANKHAAKDPNAYTFDVSRMDQSAIKSRFDEKIGYKGQGMAHSPYANRRNPGASSVRPGMMPLWQRNVDTRRNLRQPDLEEFDDVFGASNTTKSQADVKVRSSTRDEGDFEGQKSWSESDSEEGSAYEAAAAKSEGELFNWSESDSEEANEYEAVAGKDGDDEYEDDDDDGGGGGGAGHSCVTRESERKDNQQKGQGWYGHEDDLFEDDE